MMSASHEWFGQTEGLQLEYAWKHRTGMTSGYADEQQTLHEDYSIVGLCVASGDDLVPDVYYKSAELLVELLQYMSSAIRCTPHSIPYDDEIHYMRYFVTQELNDAIPRLASMGRNVGGLFETDSCFDVAMDVG